MSFRFHFGERILSGILLAGLLTATLGRSPLWAMIQSLDQTLPGRYGDILSMLPGDTNTSLAFLLLLLVATLGFLIPRQPLLVPAVLTALVLGYTTYPWGLIHWHRLIIDIPITDRGLHPVDWVLFTLPVILLITLPALLQVRAVVARYRTKGATRGQLSLVERHLIHQSLRTGMIALALVVGLSLTLHLATAFVPPSGLLVANSVLAMLLVTVLLVTALAVGTGILSNPKKTQKEA